MATSGPEKLFRCSYCEKSFGRSEHAKRHELIHTRETPFQCADCEKSFTRRDALRRHEDTHRDSHSSLLHKGGRACANCSSAKARCTGSVPCSRCLKRNMVCVCKQQSAPENSESMNSENTANATLQQQTATSLDHGGKGDVLQGINDNEPHVTVPPGHRQITYETNMTDEFWDPNILSTTNWLDTIDTVNFSDLQMDFSPMNSLTLLPNDQRTSSWMSPFMSARPFDNSDNLQLNSPSGSVAHTSAVSALSQEATTTSAAGEDPPLEAGSYYVDGSPARLPRTSKKRKRSVAHSQGLESQAAGLATSGGFRLHFNSVTNIDELNRVEIAVYAYEIMLQHWQLVCVDPPRPWIAFDQSEFPPRQLLEHFLWLFFDCFDQTLPFIHRATFSSTSSNWVLCLSMCAAGSQYVDGTGDVRSASSIHEFIRRILLYATETDIGSDLIRAQTTLLNSIGTAFCGDRTLSEHTIQSQFHFRSCMNFAIQERARLLAVAKRSNSSVEEDWHLWCALESCIRTGYSAWLLDCMWVYHFQRPSTLDLANTTFPLPCSEKKWLANSMECWQTAKNSEHGICLTLQESLKELYIDKRLPKERGEFARVLLIHGIFHRTWEVERYFSNPLSQWEPTAEKQTSKKVISTDVLWLPTIPTFAKWQNSACDSLDVLHWQANAMIGLQSGVEHPTVLHLHIARVVLLAPLTRILNLANMMTSTKAQEYQEEILNERKMIRRWAIQSQYKARLAAIHAGVVFWHVRRYSIDAFYEGPCVALATLMLWAFGTFSSGRGVSSGQMSDNTDTERHEMEGSRAQNRHRTDEEEDHDDDLVGDIVLLDRPTDDELVQEFIRRGHTMRTHMTGVGDVYGRRGPERVLIEGCKHLKALKCWGVAATWIHLLQRLQRHCVGTSR